MSDDRIPPAALALGLGGLVPFVACGIAVLLGMRIPVVGDPAPALIAYGAVILSFLGGIRWGLALPMSGEGAQARALALSVVPSLAAWLALLAPVMPALAVLAVLFLLLGVADIRMPVQGAPRWFAKLRMILTVGVVVTLLVAIAGMTR